jgi:hypothetical protein
MNKIDKNDNSSAAYATQAQQAQQFAQSPYAPQPGLINLAQSGFDMGGMYAQHAGAYAGIAQAAPAGLGQAGGMYGAQAQAGQGFTGNFDMGEKLPKKMGECNKFMKQYIKDHKMDMKGMSNDEKKALAALAWDVQKGAELGMAPGAYSTFSPETMKGPMEKLMKNAGKLGAEFQPALALGAQRLASGTPAAGAQQVAQSMPMY